MNLNEVEERQRAGPINSAVHETNDPIRPVRGVFRRILVGKRRKIDIRRLGDPVPETLALPPLRRIALRCGILRGHTWAPSANSTVSGPAEGSVTRS